jgi:hypothetical protein
MSRPRKHKFHDLPVGEEYVVSEMKRWLKSAIYNHGAATGKTFSIRQMFPRVKGTAYVVRRTA